MISDIEDPYLLYDVHVGSGNILTKWVCTISCNDTFTYLVYRTNTSQPIPLLDIVRNSNSFLQSVFSIFANVKIKIFLPVDKTL